MWDATVAVSAFGEAMKAPRLKGQNVLILDIERIKGTATVEFWDLGDYKNRRIHADDVTEWPRTICAAWKWYGEKKVEFASEWGDGAEGLALATWEAVDRAQIVVGHNIDRFDLTKLMTHWRDNGINRKPSPVKVVDTLKIARRELGDESKTLNALLERRGLAGKTDRYDHETAKAAVAGNKAAQRKIKAYNIGDIPASELLYDDLRPLMGPSHPHNVNGTIDDRPTCPACWGDNLSRNGTTLARQIAYTLYRCNDCGSSVKGTRHNRAAVTSGVR